MPSTPDRAVVSNTSPLLYLYQVGCLDLLPKLYGRIQIPPAVRAELQAGAERGIPVPDTSALEWIEEKDLDRSLLPVADLGPGEAEAIALALSSPGSLLILDDQLGRKTAHLGGITCTGTLGVIIKAKEAGFLPAVTPVLEALLGTTMHLTPQLIEAVLNEAGEA